MSKAWERRLIAGPRGYAICVRNIVLILTYTDEWKGVLGFDQFINSPVKLKPPPWKREVKVSDGRMLVGDWTDSDTFRVADWLAASSYKLICPSRLIEEAIRLIAEQNTFHPIRQWLSGLVWDNKPRIDNWLTRVGGVEDTPYTQAVGAKFLIAAVARVYDPGCKVDTVMVLEGDQGVGKSTLLRILFGEEWFLETAVELGGKDSLQMLRRKWGIELSELDSLSKSEVSKVKAFISTRVDTYRPSYGRATQDFPRQCMFAGTVNPDGSGYLKDDTGARRFWPIKLRRRVHFKALEKEREQLWAEAVLRYLAKEAWHLEDPALIATHKELTEERRQSDVWEEPIAAYVAKKKLTAKGAGFSTHDILTQALKRETGNLSRGDEMRVARILKLLGLTDVIRNADGDRIRRYRFPAKRLVGGVLEKKVAAGPYAVKT